MARGYTGEILPRDYGLMIRKHGEKLFMSPSKFALGLAHLESPRDLERRIKDLAQRHGVSVKIMREEFTDSVKESFPGLWMKKPGLHNVKRYQRGFHARVQSKQDIKKLYETSITYIDEKSHLCHCRPGCSCDDGVYGSHKNVHLMCGHTAALALALDIDNYMKFPVDKNFSGLPPSERNIIPKILFRYCARKRANGLSADQIMTDILFSILVEKKHHFEINRAVLDNPYMIVSWVDGAVRDKYDRAQFEVLREEEREGRRSRLDASIKALTLRLSESLTDKGFVPNRYVLSFKGNDFESVARRFRKENVAYDLIVNDALLPILMRKILHEKSSNLWNGNDLRSDHPYKRTGEYKNIDDTTRRNCEEKIIIPTQHSDLSKLVSQEARKEYEKVVGVSQN